LERPTSGPNTQERTVVENFSDLVGKTLVSAENTDDVLTMRLADGTVCELYHEQDCCENVFIDDVNGNFEDLIGEPLTIATEEEPELAAKEAGDDSFTWTRFTLGTAHKQVSILWYGVSNGYYSESVYFRVVPAK
jgi:hypothetical protein